MANSLPIPFFNRGTMSFEILCNVCGKPVNREFIMNHQFADECKPCFEKRIRDEKDYQELKEIMQRLMKK